MNIHPDDLTRMRRIAERLFGTKIDRPRPPRSEAQIQRAALDAERKRARRLREKQNGGWR